MVLHWRHLGVTTAPKVGVIFAHMQFLTVRLQVKVHTLGMLSNTPSY